MPTQTLLNELYDALKSSTAFQQMTSEEQSKIREKYSTVTDEEIHTAMEVMRQSSALWAELDTEQAEISKAKVGAVAEVKDAARKAEKAVLQSELAAASASSAQEAEEFIREVEASGNKTEAKKRKKIFGIF